MAVTTRPPTPTKSGLLPANPSSRLVSDSGTDLFARFPRSVDLSERARCNTALVASLASRRSARGDETIVSSTITALAAGIGASARHIGQRTLRYLEADGHITRRGSGWVINRANTGWFKFPGWITTVGLSRNAIAVMLGICSSAYADDPNGQITVTYNQLASKLGMNRTRVIGCVKELAKAGAIVVHRSRAPGVHDYNLPNRYTVCYRQLVPKPPRRPTSMAWQRPTQELIDQLMVDPEWANQLAQMAPAKRYQRRVEQAVGRLTHERSADELARKVLGGRGVADAKNIWGVLLHRLNEIPLLEDRELAQARAAARRGEISPQQLQLAEEQVRAELDLLGHTFRPE